MSRQRKAILGGLVALTGSLAVGLVDNALTIGEGATALAAGVAAYAAVYGVRNEPPPPPGRHAAPLDDQVDDVEVEP